jgi:hypothetical protein
MSTHRDWNPVNADLMSCCEISHHTGVPLTEVWTWVAFDPTFPQYRRAANRCRKFRWPDEVVFVKRTIARHTVESFIDIHSENGKPDGRILLYKSVQKNAGHPSRTHTTSASIAHTAGKS